MTIKKGGNVKRGKKSNPKRSSFRMVTNGNYKHYNSPHSDGFYPHGKPSWYSYTEDFVDVGYDYYGMAFAHTAYPGLRGEQGEGAVLGKALANLNALIAGARAAEMKFLADTGINVTEANGKDLFYTMNKIFNSKETFKRGLKYMEELDKIGRIKDEKTHTYRDVSSILEGYLNQELKKINWKKILYMDSKQIQQLINKIIGNALIKTYKQAQDFVDNEGNLRFMYGDSGEGKAAPDLSKGEKAQQAITDMIDTIEELQKRGDFGQFGYLFKITEKDLKKRAEEMQNTKKNKNKRSNKKDKAAKGQYNEATVEGNYQGNALELITSTVAAMIAGINVSNQGLTVKGYHTGQLNQMKGDSVLFVGRGDINVDEYFKEYREEVKAIKASGQKSVRMQNIQAFEHFLDKLDNNIEHVIVISDKNWSIKADFGGIEAQSKMNLQSAGEMLTRFGVGQVRELIDYLANCGAGMVQGEVNGEIRTLLQTQIAYYLFDNLQIDVKGPKPGANVVNLMNISGMYMPLSVYLEGLVKSITEAIKTPTTGMVSVNISLGGLKHQRVWTAATWDRFRETHETQSFIEYKILKNLAEFITGLAN